VQTIIDVEAGEHFRPITEFPWGTFKEEELVRTVVNESGALK
jgi:hypothetical protein